MNIVRPYIIVLALIINLLSIFSILCNLYIRQNVLRKRDFSSTAISVFMILVPITACLFCLNAYNSTDIEYAYSIILISFSVLFFALIQCFFSYVKSVENTSLDVIKAIVGVLEAGDPNLDGHSLHVQSLTMLLYEYLPLSYKILINPSNLKCASLLLDIGKLGIPRSIIQKTGKLQKEEWDFMRRHPEIGVKILKPIPSLSEILDWIKYHHERVDGTGYYHLSSDEIPLESRIIAIADTYSALTMSRSYKASLPHEEAVSELKLSAGTQLDKELVEIFCSIPLRRLEVCLKETLKTMKCYDEENFRQDIRQNAQVFKVN